MKKSQAWVDVRQLYQQARKNINNSAPVLLKLFSAQTHHTSFLPSSRPDQLPSPLKNDHDWRAQNISAANPRRYKSHLVSI
jgi:hypothetical protein